jgi:hypothetical protein
MPDPRDQKRNTSMAKFLFVYPSDKDTFDTMAPEELQRFHQKWQTWMAEGLQKGWMPPVRPRVRPICEMC